MTSRSETPHRGTRRTVVGLGANLGDRLWTLQQAVAKLHRSFPVRATSHVYETAPIGGPPQGPYLNAAALVTQDGCEASLMTLLLDIERELGRTRRLRWEPRIIDLDLLWVEGVSIETPGLHVPHPRRRERAFAVAPLLDVAPDAADPKIGERYVIPAGEIRPTSYALMAV